MIAHFLTIGNFFLQGDGVATTFSFKLADLLVLNLGSSLLINPNTIPDKISIQSISGNGSSTGITATVSITAKGLITFSFSFPPGATLSDTVAVDFLLFFNSL